MATLKCMQPQTASTITILRDLNGNATTEGTTVAVSRESFISKVKRHRYSKLEIFLAVISLLLLIALVVVTVILEAEKSEDTSTDDGRRARSERTIKSLARVLNNMDRDANPCEDFYQYACGGWEKRNYIDDSDNSVFPFITEQSKNKRQLKEILESVDVKSNYSGNAAILKVFDMYSSCMNTTAVEKFGDSELKKLLVELANFNITKERSSGYEWKNFVVKIKRRLDLDAFFTLQVLDDLQNASLRRIVVQALYLPFFHVYSTQTLTLEAQRIRERYLDYMTDVMALVTSENRDFVKQKMEEVLQLEIRIAKTQLPLNQRRNFSLIYNLVPIEKLSNMTAKFDWLSFFRNLTSGTGYTLTSREPLLITSPKMVQDILIVLNNTNHSVISNYLAWRIVHGLIEVLPSKYGKLFSQFRGGQIKPRWDTCVRATSTTLPLETTLLFAQRALPKGTWNEARDIMRNVKDTFIKIIPKQSWMDENTRKGALDKVKAMIFHIAYPGNIAMSEKSLKDFTVSNISYFTTHLNVESFMFMENFKSLKATVNRKEYEETDPMKPTAFYYPTRNKVGVSVGQLQTELFSLENYKSANFGTLGMVLGHEISHGFDIRGLKYDRNGDQREWMSNHSSGRIVQTHLCLRKSYGDIEFMGHKLGEVGDYRQAYCDSGGVSLAFEAYKTWKDHNNEEDILPGIGVTHDQLFFLSFAQMWCAKYKDSEVRRSLHAGIYPFPLRVQETIRNSKEFADAFSCARGTAMNPANKCQVWKTV